MRQQKATSTPRSRRSEPWSLELPAAEPALPLAIQLPPEFELAETTMVFKIAEKPELRDPRVLQKQTPIRANLLIKRSLGNNPPLTELAAELSQYLLKTVPGIVHLEAGPFVFTDGVEGYRSSYEFQPVPKIRLKQIHVLRVDAEGAMHFTLTVGTDARPETIEQYMSCIGATRLTH